MRSLKRLRDRVIARRFGNAFPSAPGQMGCRSKPHEKTWIYDDFQGASRGASLHKRTI